MDLRPVAFTRGLCLVASSLIAGPLLPALAATPSLSLDERVACDEAIERVRYSYQIGATRPFAEAVPSGMLQRRVRESLAQAVLLEASWGLSVRAEDLEAEMNRIARDTRFPDRLLEVYSALDHDPFLVQECLARPVLVERLARNFFAFDERIHGGTRQEAEELRALIVSGQLAPAEPHPRRVLQEIRRARAEEDLQAAGRRTLPGRRNAADVQELELADGAYELWRGQAPARIGEPGPLVEEREAFAFRVIVAEGADSARIAVYRLPKQTWEAWWRGVAPTLDPGLARAVARPLGRLPIPGAGRHPAAAGGAAAGSSPDSLQEDTPACPPDDSWANGALDDAPEPRTGHTAVWTGDAMIVWGNRGDAVANGHRYDPLTDTWSPISSVGAPSTRYGQVVVWTGARMVVWGGSLVPSYFNTGGRYDPVMDTWAPTSTVGAPSPRAGAAVAWTGSRMIVWGGTSYNQLTDTGGQYDPVTDTWTPTATLGAPTPRNQHSGVWTGSRFAVWGGFDDTRAVGTGALYDPAADVWSPIAQAQAPSPRRGHAAVWTGSRMLVWGGNGQGPLTDAARYDPATDSWTPMTTTGAPEPRSTLGVWTGTEMIVWGGDHLGDKLDTGGRYDPAADVWTPTAVTNAPVGRSGGSAVWTGDRMIIWGGSAEGTLTNTGGRYDPQSDSWTPTSTAGAPVARQGHAAVWTGNLLIVWGGTDGVAEIDSGGRYDPLTDAWAPTSLLGAPEGRWDHTAVWTGSRMIVWGGFRWTYPRLPETGGRYDPIADLWEPTATVGVPSGRLFHTAVWDGSRMLIWGGQNNDAPHHLDTGGRYDPSSDAWQPISTTGAPAPRFQHTAIWDGSRMVIWGGTQDGSPSIYLAGGGRYDPVIDAWLPISTSGAPGGVAQHTAVWTGTKMIVWGGMGNNGFSYQGGAYDPGADQWSTILTPGAVAGRAEHSAVWTGTEMVVWGGRNGDSVFSDTFNTGGRYDPVARSWRSMSTSGAPTQRFDHTAVWTGEFMIVWGGAFQSSLLFNNGGRYAMGNDTADLDADGHSVCEGDCDDLVASIFPGAPQACDGVNNDCDDPAWPTPPSDETDADADAFRVCAGDCDDADPERNPGASELCDSVDNDCDNVVDSFVTACGIGACAAVGACVSGVDDCSPGAPSPEICDGVDNDCDGAFGAGEDDLDGDGLGPCLGDCDDASSATYPGAPEVNDGEDNQCPGDPGHGVADEIEGLLGFTDPSDVDRLCWPAQAGATDYEVLRANSPSGATRCDLAQVAATCWTDPEIPAAAKGAFYLVRAALPHRGSLGQDSVGAERLGVCLPEANCSDGIDEDGDGLADCLDLGDCFRTPACPIARLTFQDSSADDIGADAIESFLAAVPAAATDFIHLSMGGGGGVPGFEWCAERADAFREQYVALAATAGMAVSGGWNVWYRQEGAAWTGPLVDDASNFYGDDCLGPLSWCTEIVLGDRSIALDPAGTSWCEGYELAYGCVNTVNVLSLTIGGDRLSACGF